MEESLLYDLGKSAGRRLKILLLPEVNISIFFWLLDSVAVVTFWKWCQCSTSALRSIIKVAETESLFLCLYFLCNSLYGDLEELR